jgi:NCS1 family nucleobase:cation symporter-1
MAITTIDRPTGEVFVTVPGGPRSEVGPNLAAPVPRALGLVDQLGLWGNLGVSLLGFTGALFVLQPTGGPPNLSMAAGFLAILIGTVLGTVPVGLAAVPGTRTGAPAMVLLRGVFGARLSALPTLLNIVQCLGWATFELVTIATAAHQVAPGLPRWAYVVIGGVISGGLAIFPLGFIRTLRRYVTVLVVGVLAYLLAEMATHPLPAFNSGSWSGFWTATDTVVGAAISFAPLAADYSRHSRTARAAFGGVVAGYGVTQVLCYVIGFLALLTVARGGADHMFGAFIALPLGTLAMAILVARELDQSFANVYSTAASTQNLRPLWDRRLLAAAICAVSTVGALLLNTGDYENFLLLIGSVFVPLSAVLVVDWFFMSKGAWDLSGRSPTRWPMLLPWFLGFVVYQLINPGYISWWVSGWQSVDSWLGFTPESWMSASILSFVAAAVLTVVASALPRARLSPMVD